MTQPLSWNLHGNDQLSSVLEKLDRTLDKVSKRLDGVTGDAKTMGRALGETESASHRASQGLERVSSEAGHTENKLGQLTRKARETATSMRESLGGVGSFIGGLGSTVWSFAQTAALGFGVAAAAAAGFALKVAADNETAAISFEVLFGSVAKSQAFLAKLQAFAAATPFEMPELRDAASRLLAVGFSAEKIIPLLTRLGDATAAMGTGSEGIKRAVYALQQMSQAGKVSLEDINQLTDAGIPALDALSAKLHTTVAKLRKDISAGKIKPEQLFDAILSGAGKTFPRLQGMMVRQSGTLTGMWSTFKDNTGQALATFAEPMLPGIKKTLDWLSVNIPKGLETLKGMGKDVAEIFKDSPLKGEFMDALDKLGDKVLPALKKGWAEAKQFMSDHRAEFEKIGRFVTEILVPALGVAIPWAIGFTVSAFETVITVTSKVIDALSGLTRDALSGLGSIIHGAAAAFGWLPDLGPKLKQAATEFDAWAAKIRGHLDSLDGRTVDIYVKTHGSIAAAVNALNGGEYVSGRASGGPVWAGQLYNINERGAEGYYAAQTGVVRTNEQMRNAMSGGGGGEVLGTLIVRHERPDGSLIREELLTLKRQRGLTKLDLA